MIGVRVAVGQRPHRIRLENPSTSVPDGMGAYTEAYAPLDPPEMWASIQPATAADLERTASGTTLATATHVVRMPFHSQVTTQTRLIFNDRIMNVIGLANLEERNIELVLVCAEVVP